MKSLVTLCLFVGLTFAIAVTLSEVFSEQPAVYIFIVPGESLDVEYLNAELKAYLAELECSG